MNIYKTTSLMEVVYPIIQQEVQADVRIAALLAMLEIEKQAYNTQITMDMLLKQVEESKDGV